LAARLWLSSMIRMRAATDGEEPSRRGSLW
jgi:hypothetical protein